LKVKALSFYYFTSPEEFQVELRTCTLAAAQQLRDSIDKWDLIKLKSFCSSKEMVSKLKRTPTE
jgi:hypothetical protein